MESASVPILPDALKLAEDGSVPGGSLRNRDFVAPITRWSESLTDAEKLLLCDAQTSGGLLVTLAASDAEPFVEVLKAEGHAAAVVGALEAGDPGWLRVL